MGDTSLLEKIRKANYVFLIGNGGSYANASHVANDLISVGVRAITLDAATLTAFANDYGYENVFAHWIEKVGQAGDLVVAFSGSGKSANIRHALALAARMGLDTHLVTHYLRGRDMQQSEEDQLVIGHELMRALRDA